MHSVENSDMVNFYSQRVSHCVGYNQSHGPTTNPIDLHNPIIQIFLGKEIDLDNFILITGPNKSQHAWNVAIDPYAIAKFFHFMIQTILETLL